MSIDCRNTEKLSVTLWDIARNYIIENVSGITKNVGMLSSTVTEWDMARIACA